MLLFCVAFEATGCVPDGGEPDDDIDADDTAGEDDDTSPLVDDDGTPSDDDSGPDDDSTGGEDDDVTGLPDDDSTASPDDDSTPIPDLVVVSSDSADAFLQWGEWCYPKRIGDVNGDGYDDLAVSPGVYEVGADIPVILGPIPPVVDLPSGADFKIQLFDYSEVRGVVAGGDLDGDGTGDVFFCDQAEGHSRIYLLGGPPHAGWGVEESVALFEPSPGCGEGCEDYCLTGPAVVPGWSGGSDVSIAFASFDDDSLLFTGPFEASEAEWDARFVDFMVGGPGDTDADGRPELMGWAALGADGAAMWEGPLSGPIDVSSAIATWSYDEHPALYPYIVPDVDGDGLDDVLGQASEYLAPGWAYTFLLFTGPFSGEVPAGSHAASFSSDAPGGVGPRGAFASVGDADGDGHRDVVVGVNTDSTVVEYGGAAYLIYGPVPGGEIFLPPPGNALKIQGQQPHGGFGEFTVWIGDASGDGLPDYAVTEPGEGRIYVFYGRPR